METSDGPAVSPPAARPHCPRAGHAFMVLQNCQIYLEFSTVPIAMRDAKSHPHSKVRGAACRGSCTVRRVHQMLEERPMRGPGCNRILAGAALVLVLGIPFDVVAQEAAESATVKGALP